MALAAIGFAKAKRAAQIMVALSSIGPGRHEHGHRGGLRARQPAARCCSCRRHVRQPPPDPVLQQVEHFTTRRRR
jgi:3D-(3,5/4)-trihydroxycyclohexane-1,2-dione acylhydrolase (decyclizing)